MAARRSLGRAAVPLQPAQVPIRLAKNLELDRRAATQKFGIIGRSESGKTYLAGKLAEGLHEIGCQLIVFDPIGNWRGLTLAAKASIRGCPSWCSVGGEGICRCGPTMGDGSRGW
jgi:DNA helicase HerA-like ATPase